MADSDHGELVRRARNADISGHGEYSQLVREAAHAIEWLVCERDAYRAELTRRAIPLPGEPDKRGRDYGEWWPG